MRREYAQTVDIKEESRLACSDIKQTHFERKWGNLHRFFSPLSSNQDAACTIPFAIRSSISQALQSSRNEEVGEKQFDEGNETLNCKQANLGQLPL